jgi:hypothetical protein
MTQSNRPSETTRFLDREREALTLVERQLEAQDAEFARAATALAESRDGTTVARALGAALRALAEETSAPPTLRQFPTPPMFGTRC